MSTPTPPHSSQELLDRVHAVLIVLFAGPSFELLWGGARDRFVKWLQRLPAPVSQLTERLFLIQLLCESFDSAILKSDQNMIRIVLEGTVEANNCVELGGERYEVVSRKIGSHFGVAYTLKNQKGEIVQHEFFD